MSSSDNAGQERSFGMASSRTLGLRPNHIHLHSYCQTGHENQMTPEASDVDLVQRAKAGDLDAFEALTTRHEQRVYSLALRMLRQEQDAEDVTQQTFLSVLENLD